VHLNVITYCVEMKMIDKKLPQMTRDAHGSVDAKTEPMNRRLSIFFSLQEPPAPGYLKGYL